ncbi:MAG: DNA replication complex GINS family protein [Candidatus Brockarchaeota archaeon]|nr:DNA replication complex GINS family protein [Candidatus Brockarchaeota archaeon]
MNLGLLRSDLELINSIVVDQIKRFEADFLNSPAKVKVLVGGHKIRTGEGNVIELEAGTTVELERWIAEELVKSGIAAPRDEDQLDRVALNRLRWLETSVSSDYPRPLPQGFYPLARRLLSGARAANQAIAGEVDSAVREIVNARVRKVLRFASAPNHVTDVYDSLQPEEQLLYNVVRNCLNAWKEGVLGAGWK